LPKRIVSLDEAEMECVLRNKKKKGYFRVGQKMELKKILRKSKAVFERFKKEKSEWRQEK